MRNLVGKGDIGGKASGFLKIRSIVRGDDNRQRNPHHDQFIRFPESFFVGTQLYDEFITVNFLWEDIERCKADPEGYYERLRAEFIQGHFPGWAERQLTALMEDITYPLAVRSSSLLEDRAGTAFAGKYSTYFVANQGSLVQRVFELKHAIKKVFASLVNPSALVYRQKRGFIDEREKMAVVIQKAVGRPYKGYFLPLLAGVGFTQNDFCWDEGIRRSDGLVRLVFGLGTRAVGRGFARLFSPGKPASRPEGNDPGAIRRFSQGKVDVLDLKENRLHNATVSELIPSGTEAYPGADQLVSLDDGQSLTVPASRLWDSSSGRAVLTFDRILRSPLLGLKLPELLRSVFETAEQGFGVPMDVEFAVNVEEDGKAYLYLLQARPLSQREELTPGEIPSNIADERLVFDVRKKVPSGSVDGVEVVVYVDPWEYNNFPVELRHELARAVGKLNRKLENRRFILVGPGRWGSNNTLLGVPVVYSEISNTRVLLEVAVAVGEFTPEVSFGTHFFQDLIEDGVLHLALFPDEDQCDFRREALQRANALPKVLEDPYYRKFDSVLKVIDLAAEGLVLNLRLDGQKKRGVGFLDEIGQ